MAAATTAALALAACGNQATKYDISPVFPLSSDKCAKYGGTAEGEGITAHCWVTKSECEQAAADWRAAMQNIPDAINFRC
jgi:hypothetical protein